MIFLKEQQGFVTAVFTLETSNQSTSVFGIIQNPASDRLQNLMRRAFLSDYRRLDQKDTDDKKKPTHRKTPVARENAAKGVNL